MRFLCTVRFVETAFAEGVDVVGYIVLCYDV